MHMEYLARDYPYEVTEMIPHDDEIMEFDAWYRDVSVNMYCLGSRIS